MKGLSKERKGPTLEARDVSRGVRKESSSRKLTSFNLAFRVKWALKALKTQIWPAEPWQTLHL